MTAIVRLALQRPYTFVVMALLLLIAGTLAALRTPADILPEIRIPVVSVAWQYGGLPPDDIAARISTGFQRTLTTTVNDVARIEANAYPGVGLVKVFFHPDVDIAIANAQIESKDTRGARTTLADLIKKYPQAEAAQAGKERLAALK